MTRSASSLAHERIVGQPERLGHLDDAGQQVVAATATAGADRRTLVHQRGERDVPPVVDVAEAVVVGDPHLVEEDLVEARAAGHLTQRPHLDAGRLHVDDEPGEPLVLGQVGVGAGDDLADVGVLRAGGPHLLAGDHPLVAVALGLGLQAGQVAAGAGLAEQLAADDVAAVHRLQVAVLGGVAAVGEDRRRDHAEPDREEALVGHLVLGLEAVLRALVGARQIAAAVLGRAGDPSEPGVELLARATRTARRELGALGVAVALLEHRHLVGALAPHELLLGLLAAGVGVEERLRPRR